MTTATRNRARRHTEHSDALQRLARIGFLARGGLWLLLGALAVRVASGNGDRKADGAGALALVASTTGGRVLLGVAGAGLAGFAVWRGADALLDPHDSGRANRVAAAGQVLLYAAFAAGTARYAIAPPPVGGEDGGRTASAKLLEWPLGRWLLALAGAAIVAVGLTNLWRAVACRFRDELKQDELPDRGRPAVYAVAIAGHVSRAVIFSLIGGFLVAAAIGYDPERAVGLDGALRRVAAAPYGRPLLLLLAAGFVSYGGYVLLEARYRKVLRS